MLEKIYKPKKLETHHYNNWEKIGAFKAGAGLSNSARKNAESFSIILPPPNITGSLHMGHAFNNVIQDILIRYNRMRGKDTLWQPGIDHAGIATQIIIENDLAKKKLPTKYKLGRIKFIEKIWEWKKKYGNIIQDQQRRLGSSCDWSRSKFTMDKEVSKSTLKAFVKLYEQGYIYRAKRLVNWDVKLQTAISDIEVEQIEKNNKIWYLKYPIKNVQNQFVTIATTRPETIFGDTGIAVNPNDDRYKKIIGKTVILPLVGREIPIISDNYVDQNQGSGAVKITPAHDFNDFKIGKRSNLKIINIFNKHACLNKNVPKEYIGLERFDARKIVIKNFSKLNLLVKTNKIFHTVPYGNRSGSIIEPWLSDQWYIDIKKLAIPAIKSIKNNNTEFIPNHWNKTYFNWMNNIEPWCISRQLWWGHQIPVWYGPDHKIFVALNKDKAQLLANKYYNKNVILIQDEDVLDTWFSSALWPFVTMGWPKKTIELKKYYKTNVLVTAFDIIFFWVARMMMMGIHFMQEEPFKIIYIHAIIRDEFGVKMSKSKGNTMNPINLIDKYGADAVRFTLSSIAGQGRDIKLSDKLFENNRNFITKLWNVCYFAEIHKCKTLINFNKKNIKLNISKWILHELSNMTDAVENYIEKFKFNDASDIIYKFTWHIFCDWYIEFAKVILFGKNNEDKIEIKSITAYVIDHLLHIMHPFIPFVTEELWNKFNIKDIKRKNMLIISPWPLNFNDKDQQSAKEIFWVIKFITKIRSNCKKINNSGKNKIIIVNPNNSFKIKLSIYNNFIKKIANLEKILITNDAPKKSIEFLMDDIKIAIPLNNTLNIEIELSKLTKKINKSQEKILILEKKLNNNMFISKAPENIINKQKNNLYNSKKILLSLKKSFIKIKKLNKI